MDLFDPSPVIHNRSTARPGADFLHKKSADMLLERLQLIKKSFSQIAVLGRQQEYIASKIQADNSSTIAFELSPDTTYDLIISNMEYHRQNDVPARVAVNHALLQEEGLFLSTFLGGETLAELRHCFIAAETELSGAVSPRIHPMMDLASASGILSQPGFKDPVSDRQQVSVTYSSAGDLMQDLRAMGEGNILAERVKSFSPKKLFHLAEEKYQQLYNTDNNRLTATFELIFLSGWK
ncbi:MAG: hypothetical protein ACPGXY_02190 [Alphaproteobacteria bacterium]